MFVGHYAAALAAKGAEPRAPLWTYALGAQLIDIGWSGLVMTGAERVSFDPKLPGSPLVLEHMPWTHSLPAALLWAVAAALLVRAALKLPWGAAIMVGLVVFSHWLADLLVHRPDLELWFGGTKVGLGLWNYPVPEQAVEMGFLAMGAAWWGWRRGKQGQSVWPALVFTGLLMALQIVVMVMPGATNAMQMGLMALGAYLAVGAVAWIVDRGRPRLT